MKIGFTFHSDHEDQFQQEMLTILDVYFIELSNINFVS